MDLSMGGTRGMPVEIAAVAEGKSVCVAHY